MLLPSIIINTISYYKCISNKQIYGKYATFSEAMIVYNDLYLLLCVMYFFKLYSLFKKYTKYKCAICFLYLGLLVKMSKSKELSIRNTIHISSFISICVTILKYIPTSQNIVILHFIAFSALIIAKKTGFICSGQFRRLFLTCEYSLINYLLYWFYC